MSDLTEHMPPRIQNNKQMRGAWMKGYRARKDSKERHDCPYRARCANEWYMGWDYADAEALIERAKSVASTEYEQ